MKRISVFALSLIFSFAASAQTVKHAVIVPDIPGYVTLKGDMHLHTVFSDGFKVMNFFVDAGVPLDYTIQVK